jgi:hypothetical protein
MANPFPFTAGQVLTAAQLNSIGEAGVSWSPTYDNITIGNGTVVAKYVQVNKLVSGYWQFTLGSTSSIGAGAAQISAPVTINSSQQFQLVGDSLYFDSSAGAPYIGPTFIASTTKLQPNVSAAGGTYATRAAMTSTVPAAFGTGDQIYMTFTYEAA